MRIALTGNPNSGKTTMFNALTGRSEKAWEIDRPTVETVSDFIFGGSKITADGDCSNEIKRRLLLGRKL